MKILIGQSGFVGSNLLGKTHFNEYFNSKNIKDAYNINPDLCVYAGVKAQKFIANKQPKDDLSHINEAIENIEKINPKKLVLISTIDVLDKTQDADESHVINSSNLMPYGKHRRYLEEWVINNIKDYHIVRLPALYGKNLKKNFIYDLLNLIPSMLSQELFLRYSKHANIVSKSYIDKDNNFYFLKEGLSPVHKKKLLEAFEDQNFTALHFTDSRATFQFYPLSRLSQDLSRIIEHTVRCIQLVTEPVKASEVYKFLYNEKFINKVSHNYPKYNLKTRHSSIWNRDDGYLMGRGDVLEDLKRYMDAYQGWTNINES